MKSVYSQPSQCPSLNMFQLLDCLRFNKFLSVCSSRISSAQYSVALFFQCCAFRPFIERYCLIKWSCQSSPWCFARSCVTCSDIIFIYTGLVFLKTSTLFCCCRWSEFADWFSTSLSSFSIVSVWFFLWPETFTQNFQWKNFFSMKK